jgi:hypothetical protein
VLLVLRALSRQLNAFTAPPPVAAESGSAADDPTPTDEILGTP